MCLLSPRTHTDLRKQQRETNKTKRRSRRKRVRTNKYTYRSAGTLDKKKRKGNSAHADASGEKMGGRGVTAQTKPIRQKPEIQRPNA
eukprot:1687091-Prymnesium_polylepis.1